MKIIFQRTNHTFLNAGIISLYLYLRDEDEDPEIGIDFKFELKEQGLLLECEEMIPLLEHLYYKMGKEIYDTSTQEAYDKKENRYLDLETDTFKAFPKKKTYGFAALLTNDAAGKTKNPDNTLRKKTIAAKKPELAFVVDRFEKEFERLEKPLGNQLYINEEYIKITRLILEDKYLNAGTQFCPLTGEGFEKLMGGKNISPFLADMKNFMSVYSTKSSKIGWKALYLVRFAPRLCLYKYTNGLDRLFCYFYDAPNLDELYKFFSLNKQIYLDETIKMQGNHLVNFHIVDPLKKQPASLKDYTGANEMLFALMFTFYQNLLPQEATGDFSFDEIESPKINLTLLRMDKFSGTMRPEQYEVFNHFEYTLRYLKETEAEGISWAELLKSLKFIKTNQKSGENSYELERKRRDTILGKIMQGQSILSDVAQLYYDVYLQAISGEWVGYKNYHQLSKLLLFNEKKVIYLNQYKTNSMDSNMQELSYKMGTQLGMKVLELDDGVGTSKRDKAKAARKYVIGLQKSRTLTDFLDAIIRIQNKYGLSVKKELFQDMLTEKNFKLVRSFIIIGALNTLNFALFTKSKKES